MIIDILAIIALIIVVFLAIRAYKHRPKDNLDDNHYPEKPDRSRHYSGAHRASRNSRSVWP